MARNYNTDRNGYSFSEETKRLVWNKSQTVPGYDSNKIRKDHCDAWINMEKQLKMEMVGKLTILNLFQKVVVIN